MMQNIEHGFLTDRAHGKISLLPILALLATVIIAGTLFFVWLSDDINPVKQYYLIPWIFLTCVAIAVPNLILWYQGKFKLYNPIVFAAWTYFIPAFVFGGIIVASGLSNPFFVSFIQDPETDLPFTMQIVILGYCGLSFGFLLPFGKKTGKKISDYLPSAKWESESLFTAGGVLLGIGFLNTILGYASGVLGYQKIEEAGSFDGILFLMTLMWLEAGFLLWLLLFKRNLFDFKAILTGAILISTAVAKALYAGNRGGLLSVFIMVLMAFLLTRRKITLKQGMTGLFLLIFCIIAGMIYGTTFRNLKGSESQIGLDQYTEHIFETFETVSKSNTMTTFEQGLMSLAERLDAVSSLAVVVSNYEKLAPYEESYGLDNNIWKDTVTFVIPRVIWQEKPLASEPRKYGELYFNFGENSFTITPMGDLLRNFGVPGVFIGMALLGFLLRILYAAMIEDNEFSYWKTVFYFMILTAVSYESFYGSIIPYITKVGVISVIGILVVNFFVNKQKRVIK